jgi:hypothetical protein
MDCGQVKDLPYHREEYNCLSRTDISGIQRPAFGADSVVVQRLETTVVQHCLIFERTHAET